MEISQHARGHPGQRVKTMSSEKRQYGTIEEEQATLNLALKTLKEHCTVDNNFKTVATIAKALKGGDKLAGSPLLSSNTNYAFKVYLEKQPKVALFCKVCHPYANWDPSQSHVPLARVENEFQALQRCLEIIGDDAPVATPYFCLELTVGAKMLVCEYVSSVEPLTRQFGQGKVDQRVIPKLARAVALLNSADIDPHFNEGVLATLQGVLEFGKNTIEKLASSDGDGDDKAVVYFRELGGDRCRSIIAAMDEHFSHRDVFLHNDFVLLNVLVPSLPRPNADVFICDFEMSICGPIGKDVGCWKAFPIAFALHHAAAGRKVEALHMLDCCIQFFDCYAKTCVKECSKKQEFLQEVFRSSLGWISYWTLFVMYLFSGQILTSAATFPIEGLSEEAKARARASLGYTGTLMAEIGFLNKNPNFTLEELRALFKKIVEDEIEELLAQSET